MRYNGPVRRAFALALLVVAPACGVSQGLYLDIKNQLDRCESDSNAYRSASGRRLTELQREREALLARTEQMRAEHLNDQQLLGDLASSHQATRRDLADLRRARDLASARNRSYRALLGRLEADKLLGPGRLVAVVERGRLIVRVPDELLFAGPGATLTSTGEQTLRRLAGALKELADRDILVSAHTDNAAPWRRSATGEPPRWASNWELSAARAVAVVQLLQSSGVDPRRLTAAGSSEFDPVADNRTEATRAQNRRVDIIVLPHVDELPRLDDVRADATAD